MHADLGYVDCCKKSETEIMMIEILFQVTAYPRVAHANFILTQLLFLESVTCQKRSQRIVILDCKFFPVVSRKAGKKIFNAILLR